MTTLPVLIVGAGPTGLTMACELARHGVAFRIIDKKAEPTRSSNATWIQARTMEMFAQMGLVKRFLKVGHRCRTINAYIAGKLIATIPFDAISSNYPYVLTLPQSETEKILLDRLSEVNCHIERSMELIDVEQQDDHIIAKVRDKHRQITSINCQWLMACDGANSTIREKTGVHFPGEDLSEQFVVADASIESFNTKNEIHVFFDKGTLFAASPLGANRYRIMANLHSDVPRQKFYEGEVINMVQERGYGSYYVTNVAWISPFWIHGRVVDKMRDGSIFLCGDAAHLHSPLGGQGMNIGMQDAFNLAWKLALVIKDKAKPALLDSYQEERHPEITRVVKETDELTKLILFDKSFLTKLREYSHQLKKGDGSLKEKINSWLSQTQVRYLQSTIIAYQELSNTRSPKPGEHFSNVTIGEKTHLYDYLRTTHHQILIFSGTKLLPAAEIKAWQDWQQEKASTLVDVHFITPEIQPHINSSILDNDHRVHQHYHITQPTVYVLRPDHYVAYCRESTELAAVEDFLQCYLTH